MKIIVYAISKNESRFVNRWYESMKEADDIYVLDTGSTDDTVNKLKSLGVHVESKIINPWRFDVARNESLKLVPEDADICVCTDLDEVFNPGWRMELERTWDNSNRLKYVYNWYIENNIPKISFMYEKIHDRHNYKWIYPVHEVLKTNIEEKIIVNKNIVLNHYPDREKSRSSYLPLLELAIKENPDNDRILHYLGREYMYHKEYNKAIDTLIKHTMLDNTWYLEKCASMRFIARCYKSLNRFNEAKMWLLKAIDTAPNIREGYVELALLEYDLKEYFNSIINCIKAKTINNKELLYINEPFCYDGTIDDLLSLNYYCLGLNDEAYFFVDKALVFNNKDERLIHNKNIFAK